MCGLFGWQLKKPTPRMDIVGAVLSFAMVHRGRDSWGFYNWAEPVQKGLGDMCDCVAPDEFANPLSFLAHTRQATIGDKTIPNSHPFHFGNTIGAHNGSIWNYEELNKKYNRTCEVDSMHLIHHLDEDKPLSDLQGYGAVTWLNTTQPETIWLGKFNSGTLEVAELYDENGEILGSAWASTSDALYSALGTARINYKGKTLLQDKRNFIVDGEVWELKTGKFDIKSKSYKPAQTYGNWNESGVETGGKKNKKDRYQHRHPDVTANDAGYGQPTSNIIELPSAKGKTGSIITNSKCFSCDEWEMTALEPQMNCRLCFACMMAWGGNDRTEVEERFGLKNNPSTDEATQLEHDITKALNNVLKSGNDDPETVALMQYVEAVH